MSPFSPPFTPSRLNLLTGRQLDVDLDSFYAEKDHPTNRDKQLDQVLQDMAEDKIRLVTRSLIIYDKNGLPILLYRSSDSSAKGGRKVKHGVTVSFLGLKPLGDLKGWL